MLIINMITYIMTFKANFHDKENMISYRNHITGQNKKCSPVGITPSGEHFVYQFFDRAL